MRIAIFTETYPPYINGIATQTASLKKIYEEMGHEVLVVTVGAEKLDETTLIDNVVYVPGILLKKIYNYRLAIPAGNMRKKIPIKFNPDIIHIQNEFGIGNLALRVAKKRNIPVVYTLHSEYDKFLFYVGLKYFEEFSQNISANYFGRFSRRATIITSPSPKAQEYIERQGLDKRVVILDNAVNFEEFRPSPEKEAFRKEFRKKYNLDEKTKAFVFVGRIGKEKNIQELVENWIYTDLPKEKAVLFIVGGGPMLDELRDLISTNGFDDRIVLTGPVPNTEISKYLFAMDYYTTASLSEMHSISMLEAMASGLFALIKLDKPNEKQIIPGKNGYQWETKEDFKELFNKVLDLSEEEQAKLKENVIEYSKENDFKKQAEKLLAIYRDAIDINKQKLKSKENK